VGVKLDLAVWGLNLLYKADAKQHINYQTIFALITPIPTTHTFVAVGKRHPLVTLKLSVMHISGHHKPSKANIFSHRVYLLHQLKTAFAIVQPYPYKVT